MINSLFNLNNDERFRSIGSSNGREFVRFLDARLEQGHDASLPLFPKAWKWFGEGLDQREISDVPGVIGAGVVLSQRAYTALLETFSDELSNGISFQIDGHIYYWISPPTVSIDETKVDDRKLNIFIEDKRFRKCFSKKFIEALTAVVPPLSHGSFLSVSTNNRIHE